MSARTKWVGLLVGALLVWAARTAVQIGATFDFGTVGLAGLVDLAAILVLLVATLRGRRRAWVGLVGFPLFFISSTLVAGLISDRQREATIAAARPILDAAERFRADTGAYPRSLGDLVPAYLPVEPRTRMGVFGTRFRYSGDRDRFRITFALPAWMWCAYDSTSKRWTVGD